MSSTAAPLARRPHRRSSNWTSFLSGSNVAIALAPAALGLLLLSVLTSSASGVTLLAVLRAVGYWTVKQGRRISRRLSTGLGSLRAGSRRLSGHLGQVALQQSHTWRGAGQRSLALGGAAITLALLRVVYKVRTALRGFDFSVRLAEHEEELDTEVKERLVRWSHGGLPRWGRGLPGGVPPGVWRPFLAGGREPQEVLEDISNSLGLWSRPIDITSDQLTEGIRMELARKFEGQLHMDQGEYWTEEEARSIALALAADCGLQLPLPPGGLEECVPVSLSKVLPWPTPKWLQVLQYQSFKVLRVFFHAGLSFKSRFVKTPFGMMHVLDSDPDRQGLEDPENPPLLLQHGMFVTGWSMMLLAWFLSRHRRVVLPDLFDFEYGFSISDGWKSGKAVRHVKEHIESLLSVVRELQLQTRGQPIDIAGHSFGGFLSGALANACEAQKLPVRKVVLLAPGGPPARPNPVPDYTHLVNRPMEYVEEELPRWAPVSVVKMVMKLSLGVLFSANNCNTIFGLRPAEYFGGGPETGFNTNLPTLLLWGDQDNVAVPRRSKYLGNMLKQNFPRLDAYWVRGSGHNLQFDGVVRVAEAMEAFLNPQQAASGGSRPRPLLRTLLFFTNRKVERMKFDTADPMNNIALDGPTGSATPSIRAKL